MGTAIYLYVTSKGVRFVDPNRSREGSERAKVELSSTFALFGERRRPGFPGLTRRATRVFENPAGREGVQKVEITGFSRLYRTIGLRKRAEVELRG
jgi:hypothetical protein